MSTITHQPDSLELQWQTFESTTREFLGAKMGIHEDEISQALDGMKDGFMRTAKAAPFASGAEREQTLRDLEEWLSSQFFTIVKAALLRNIDRHRLPGAR